MDVGPVSVSGLEPLPVRVYPPALKIKPPAVMGAPKVTVPGVPPKDARLLPLAQDCIVPPFHRLDATSQVPVPPVGAPSVPSASQVSVAPRICTVQNEKQARSRVVTGPCKCRRINCSAGLPRRNVLGGRV